MTDSFAERLARALDARDVKQVELAEKTGISKSAISQYLSGAFVPKQRNTYKIAAADDELAKKARELEEEACAEGAVVVWIEDHLKERREALRNRAQ